jgi:hypothetical protein
MNYAAFSLVNGAIERSIVSAEGGDGLAQV